MRVAERVIGTLDVHSTDVNAFTPEDGLVIQSLADQIAIAIENARLYDSSRELAVLEERHRLARELHDSVTQSLFSLDLVAKTITTYLKRDPEQAEARIQRMRQITHDTLQEMRSVIFDLRPPNLEQDGLIVALRQHVNRMRWPSGPDIDLETTGERRLPLSVEKELFRIAQEAINNALKHSGAQHVNVVLTLNGGQAILQVSDDGRGFDVSAPPADRQAFGLIGMRERAQALNGRFQIASAPDRGTRIEVRLPLNEGDI
jgi:signal transduction histidine kinase